MPDHDDPALFVDWNAVRAAHASSAMTIEEITDHFGISKDRLYRRAKAEGWPSRNELASEMRTRAARPEPPTTPVEKRAALAARLFHALEERILAIEEEALVHDAAHGERDAKALTAMARALDMLGDMLEATDTAHPQTESPHEEIDADEFRQLLTDRLDRLCQVGEGA